MDDVDHRVVPPVQTPNDEGPYEGQQGLDAGHCLLLDNKKDSSPDILSELQCQTEHDDDDSDPSGRADGCHVGGGTASERRQDSKSHRHPPRCGSAGHNLDGVTALKGQGGTNGHCVASAELAGGSQLTEPTRSERHDYPGSRHDVFHRTNAVKTLETTADRLPWMQMGCSSFECWDPGGLSMPVGGSAILVQ